MGCGEFSWEDASGRLGLSVRDEDLHSATPEADLPDYLATMLRRNLPLAININTVQGKSELIVAPLLAGLKILHPSVAFFSGVDLDVALVECLSGAVGFMFSLDPRQDAVGAPVCVVAETVNHDIHAAIPTCLAEMAAAQKFNQASRPLPAVHGIVSNGARWRFMSLAGDGATIDSLDYPIENARKIFGILTHIVLDPVTS